MPGESLPKFLAALVQPRTRCGGRSDRRFENTAQFCRTGIPYIILRVEYLPGEANESDTRERVCLRLRPWASEDHPKRAAAVYPELRELFILALSSCPLRRHSSPSVPTVPHKSNGA